MLNDANLLPYGDAFATQFTSTTEAMASFMQGPCNGLLTDADISPLRFFQLEGHIDA